MKSIQVLRRFSFNEWGGTESVVWNCSKKLIQKGHDTRIFATSALDETGKTINNGIEIEKFNYFYPHLYLTEKNRKLLDKKGGNPYSYSMFKAITNSPRVDILHCHTMNRLANIVRLASRKINIPYVVSFHGGYFNVPRSEVDEMMKPLRHTFNYGKIFDLILKNNRFLVDADGIICVGYQESLAAKERFPDKCVEYLPNGVDLERFSSPGHNDFREKYSIPHDKPIILCVSRIDYQKNQEILVELTSELKKRKKDVHLVLIGPVTSASYLEKIEKIIDAYGIKNDITIIKGLKEDSADLKNAYNSASCFILPSVHEPFGIVVLEAWASRIPVIASNVGGLRNLIEDRKNGLFFDNRSVRDLTEKYLQLSDDHQLREKIIEESSTTVKNSYSWETVTDRLIRFYSKVIDNYKRGK